MTRKQRQAEKERRDLAVARRVAWPDYSHGYLRLEDDDYERRYARRYHGRVMSETSREP